MEKVTYEQLQSELKQFYGTEKYYKITPFNDLVITDGVKHWAERVSGYWALTDFTALECYLLAKQDEDRFSLVEIVVDENNLCHFKASHDIDQEPYWQAKQKDLLGLIPQGVHKFYLIDNVLLLPSEY